MCLTTGKLLISSYQNAFSNVGPIVDENTGCGLCTSLEIECRNCHEKFHRKWTIRMRSSDACMLASPTVCLFNRSCLSFADNNCYEAWPPCISWLCCCCCWWLWHIDYYVASYHRQLRCSELGFGLYLCSSVCLSVCLEEKGSSRGAVNFDLKFIRGDVRTDGPSDLHATIPFKRAVKNLRGRPTATQVPQNPNLRNIRIATHAVIYSVTKFGRITNQG